MVEIKGNDILMVRGDTLKMLIAIKDNTGNTYTPVQGDKLRFALKKSYTDKYPLIVKNIPIDTCELYLASRDTKFLEQPETYVYDIQITLNNGVVDTFIRGTLTLIEEVY